MNPIRIFPSLISSDILNLATTIQALAHHCAGFHIDIMDNHFVPNLTWGPAFANAIDAHSPHPSWVHLMVDKPAKMLASLKIKKNSIISFHLEATTEPEQIIAQIRERNWIPSITLKPATMLEQLYPYLPDINHVLLMSVEPGFSGQQFLASSLPKLVALTNYIKKNNLTCTVAMDGGINKTTLEECVMHGATDFAAAAAIFGQPNVLEALSQLS
jgi:ribulose-phosphate 3-epimerase